MSLTWWFHIPQDSNPQPYNFKAGVPPIQPTRISS